MNWQTLCEDPLLQNLPYKIETDRWNHIVMSPATNRHSAYQSRINRLLGQHFDEGESLVECSIATPDGVKVADVVWASGDFLRRNGFANPYPEAPEIVVEVLSPSNTLGEKEEKKELYFARGAREFWLCDDDGGMRFFDAHGEQEHSALAPAFPRRVPLPA